MLVLRDSWISLRGPTSRFLVRSEMKDVHFINRERDTERAEFQAMLWS